MVGERRSQNFSIDKASQGQPRETKPTLGLAFAMVVDMSNLGIE